MADSFFSLIANPFRKGGIQDQLPELVTTPDYAKIRDAFTDEITRAAEGSPSSLLYLKHTLKHEPLARQGIVQGIVIGGTNYIISTQELLANNERKILSLRTGVLPTIHDKNVLLSFLQEHKDDRVEAIGVNFGFPLEPVIGPFGELDGRLTRASKEHAFLEVINNPIGDIVRQAFEKDLPVSVANDTVCLTLAGDGNEHASMIAGTGFNVGFKLFEEGKPIVVNLETGNFNKFEPSPSVRELDQQSKQPGTQLFEKVISGKYLAEIFNVKARRLGLQIGELATSQDLSDLSNETANHDANLLARALLQRSAFMVAACLAGIYNFRGRPRQFIIIGEGSLLWKGWQYHENIMKQLLDLGIPRNTIQIKHIKNSSINGAIGLLTT